MENKKAEKVSLNDELLDMVGGGVDEAVSGICTSPSGMHEMESYEPVPGVYETRCKWCGFRHHKFH